MIGKKKRLKVRLQLDTYDCGPACLDTIMRFYKRNHPAEQIRRLCRMDRLGSSLGAIARAAEVLGFRTLAVKVSYQELLEKAPVPCIAFLTQGHYVVVEEVRKRRVLVADPSIGSVAFSRTEFEQAWLSEGHRSRGVLLLLEPAEGAVAESTASKTQSARLFLRPLWMEVKRHIKVLCYSAILSLSIQLLLPLLSAAVVDVSIGTHNVSILWVICIAEACLLLGRLSVDMVQSWVLACVGAKCDIALVSQFLGKLTKLPIAFFDGKTAGDLIQRINDQKTIEQFLTASFGQLLSAGLSLIVFSAVLILVKPVFFLVFALGSSIYILYSFAFFKRQRILNYKNFRLSARKQGVILELLTGMPEIKLNNAERQRRLEWESTQTSLARIQIKSQLLAVIQNTGGTFLNQATSLSLVLLSAYEVIQGSMSLGTMVAVQFIVGQLNWPLQQFVGMIIRSQDAALSYVRSQQIQDIENEETTRSILAPNPRADITFKDVNFGYGGTSPKLVLKNISLTIPHGKTTAIVGRSGSGKTSLLKLILKFYEPTGGEVLVGGAQLSQISPSSWREMCGVVMQDGHVFSDSVLRNIALNADDIDEDRVAEVCRISQIAKFVESLPLGYKTRIGRDGIGISKGQAQRILIARALYKDPQCLLFDEATSALDSQTEAALVISLRDALVNRTALIIAHRLSTVRAADQIVVLDDGEIVEIGKHDHLVDQRGLYYTIVKNQLELGD